jgi:hypothetical protein
MLFWGCIGDLLGEPPTDVTALEMKQKPEFLEKRVIHPNVDFLRKIHEK